MAARTTLLRNHLARALVGDGRSGYFSKDVIAQLAHPLDFRAMNSEREYRQALAAEYSRNGRAWLTPVEIFQPHYAEAIGRSMLRRHERAYGADEPLRVCEIGGGTGTAAVSILRWLQRSAPREYERCRYLLLEPSERNAQMQANRLRAAGVPAHRAEVVHAEADRWHEVLGGPQRGAWSLLLLEVLDNVPHDKLRHDMRAAALLEAHVVPAADAAIESASALGRPLNPFRIASAPEVGDELFREVFWPLADPTLCAVAELLKLDSVEGVDAFEAALLPKTAGPAWLGGLSQALLSLSQTHQAATRDVFVPTGCHLLLSHLCETFPEHQLTVADFTHWRPDSPSAQQQVVAVNSPVVQSQVGGCTRDWGSNYLAAPLGEADIMFSTSFEALGELYAHACGGRRRGTTLSTAEFMRRYADVVATSTACGYNPLLQDFTNTAFFVTGEEAP